MFIYPQHHPSAIFIFFFVTEREVSEGFYDAKRLMMFCTKSNYIVAVRQQPWGSVPQGDFASLYL